MAIPKHNEINPDIVSKIVRNAIIKAAKEYEERSNYLANTMHIPEYLVGERIYDTPWKNLKVESVSDLDEPISVRLDEPTKDTKKLSG